MRNFGGVSLLTTSQRQLSLSLKGKRETGSNWRRLAEAPDHCVAIDRIK
jgi:hypothetical protein